MEPSPHSEEGSVPGYDYEKYSDEVNNWTTFVGKRWHIEFIKIPEQTQKIVIEAEIENQPNARIGIWAPNSDIAHYKLNAGEAFEFDKFNERSGINTMTKSWTFGNKSSIELITNPVDYEQEIQLLILARPVNLSLGLDLKINFSIKINDIEEINQSYTYIQENEIKDNDKNSHMGNEFDLFEQLYANRLNGLGNIVHPKQYFTIRGLMHLNDEVEYINENKELRVGYIGTDTTENIRSVIRWMNASNMLKRVSELVIYYTTEWDKVFFKTSGLKEELNAEYPKLKVTTRELSYGVIASEKKRQNCDIVISTYVAPWISEEDSKRDYLNLLDNIMGPNSYLISVDPKRAHNSVRSFLMNRRYNNEDLYKNSENEGGLDMICFTGPISNESESVEWSIWWRGN